MLFIPSLSFHNPGRCRSHGPHEPRNHPLQFAEGCQGMILHGSGRMFLRASPRKVHFGDEGQPGLGKSKPRDRFPIRKVTSHCSNRPVPRRQRVSPGSARKGHAFQASPQPLADRARNRSEGGDPFFPPRANALGQSCKIPSSIWTTEVDLKRSFDSVPDVTGSFPPPPLLKASRGKRHSIRQTHRRSGKGLPEMARFLPVRVVFQASSVSSRNDSSPLPGPGLIQKEHGRAGTKSKKVSRWVKERQVEFHAGERMPAVLFPEPPGRLLLESWLERWPQVSPRPAE